MNAVDWLALLAGGLVAVVVVGLVGELAELAELTRRPPAPDPADLLVWDVLAEADRILRDAAG